MSIHAQSQALVQRFSSHSEAWILRAKRHRGQGASEGSAEDVNSPGELQPVGTLNWGL